MFKNYSAKTKLLQNISVSNRLLHKMSPFIFFLKLNKEPLARTSPSARWRSFWKEYYNQINIRPEMCIWAKSAFMDHSPAPPWSPDRNNGVKCSNLCYTKLHLSNGAGTKCQTQGFKTAVHKLEWHHLGYVPCLNSVWGWGGKWKINGLALF